MAFVAAALPYIAAAGAVASAGAAVYSGNAQAAQAGYQAQVAANNATIAQQNATYALQAGAAKEQASRIKTAALVAQQKAIQGASGLDVNSGSDVDVRGSTNVLGELDALTIRNNAAREAYGYGTQGSNFTAQAGLDRAAASNDATSGYIGGASSLLSSASSIGEKFGFMQTDDLGPVHSINADTRAILR